MTQRLIFDTLRYAKILKTAGIQQAETHAEALADAIT